MPQQQHRYTAAATVTQNVGRIDRITLLPTNQAVEVVYVIGEEAGGVFVESDRVNEVTPYADLTAPVQAMVDNLEMKLLQRAETTGILPAGSVEPV